MQVSADGTTWSTIATATPTSASVTVSFPAQTTRYLRLLQTGTASSWWSIADTYVLTAGSVSSQPAALSRTGWAVSSNPVSGDPAANAIDGNASTRWSTGAAMTNGQYYQIDMGAGHAFDQVTMDSGGSAGDYARGYSILTSNDLTSWVTVATGTGTSAVVTSRFPTTTARYVRIVQTGTATSWWSLAELNLYAG